MDDFWEPLPVSRSDCNCFLNDIPNLVETALEELTGMSDLYNVTARPESEELRIHSASKLRSLYKLGDDIYRTMKIRFHCNLRDVVEGSPRCLIHHMVQRTSSMWVRTTVRQQNVYLCYNKVFECLQFLNLRCSCVVYGGLYSILGYRHNISTPRKTKAGCEAHINMV